MSAGHQAYQKWCLKVWSSAVVHLASTHYAVQQEHLVFFSASCIPAGVSV